MPYGVFDAALYGERGGYPTPPAPRRITLNHFIAAIEFLLLGAVVAFIMVLSDRASAVPPAPPTAVCEQASCSTTP